MLSETVLEWTKKWKEEGKIEGEIEGKTKVARQMREEGMDSAVIFRLTGIRVEDLDAKAEKSEE